MKVMAVNRVVGEPIIEPLSVDIIPDSAIIKDGKPFFVPEISEHWKFRIALSFRICRLGKHIARKFASRYFDAFAISLRIVPCELVAKLQAQQLAQGIATAFDGALILGSWIPCDRLSAKILLAINGEEYELDMDNVPIEPLIESLSHFWTFKMGDILIPCVLPVWHNLTIGTTILGSVNGEKALRLNIR